MKVKSVESQRTLFWERLHTNAQKTETFADSLKQQFCLNGMAVYNTERLVNQNIQSLENFETSTNSCIFAKEVKIIIFHMKNRKAPGPDSITKLTLKHLPKKS